MTSTSSSEVTFERDGQELRGVLCRPDVAGELPAVVLVPAIHGISPYILTVGRRLAAAEYLTLVVDIYSRGDKPADLSSGALIGAAVAALPDERVSADVVAAGDHLRSLEGVRGVGVLGFCIGGLYSMLAARAGDTFDAAVNFYGMIRYAELTEQKPASPIDRVGDLAAPLLCHFGNQDPWCAPADVDALEGKLAEASKVYEICRYSGAGHAFHEHHRPAVYRPVAASAAWQSSVTFLDYYLKGIHA